MINLCPQNAKLNQNEFAGWAVYLLIIACVSSYSSVQDLDLKLPIIERWVSGTKIVSINFEFFGDEYIHIHAFSVPFS